MGGRTFTFGGHTTAGWRGTTRIGALTAGLADQVLAHPHQWPTEIVGAAVQHTSTRLARLPDVAHLAATQHWFELT